MSILFPYGAFFTKFLIGSMIVAALAGFCELEALLAPVLSTAKFNSFLLLTFALYMVLTMTVDGVSAINKQKHLNSSYSNIWMPIQMILCAALLIPGASGTSTFSAMFLGIMHFVAGL